MYDCETTSLWVHTTGKAMIGEHKGKSLEFLPSTVVTWETWKQQHPATLVLDVKQGVEGLELKRNPEMAGLSLGQPQNPKLYPLRMLQENRLINDQHEGRAIVIFFDPESWQYAAFESGDRTFAWQDGKMIDSRGKRWDPVEGTSEDQSLRRLPITTWRMSAWKRFYPKGSIFETGKSP